jgi:hypothetical protein
MKNMKKNALVLIVVLVSSCSKHNTSNGTYNPCNRILEVMEYEPYSISYQTIATLTYDQAGRISTVVGSALEKTLYTYYNDSIVMKATDINGTDISQTYYLDNEQRVVSTSLYNEDYQYNVDGYLVAYKQPYGTNGQVTGFTQYYLNYQNGNLSEVYTNDQSVGRNQVTFGYYSELDQDLLGYNSPFYCSSVIYDRNTFFLIKDGYFGKQSANLLESIDLHNGYPSGTFNYQKDSSGRINIMSQAYSFRYQCP